MNWISEIGVYPTEEGKILHGTFSASAGEFECKVSGDGNAQTHEFSFSGGQLDDVKFTITGEWEIRELAELLQVLVDGKVDI
jgi:hypothetical protein